MQTLLWDFDGTLAYRAGVWSGTLAERLSLGDSFEADIAGASAPGYAQFGSEKKTRKTSDTTPQT